MLPDQAVIMIGVLKRLHERRQRGTLTPAQYRLARAHVIAEFTPPRTHHPPKPRRWRVVGILLATTIPEVFSRDLDVAEVQHDCIPVDLEVDAPGPERAAADAAWFATKDYASWRWREPPAVEEVGS